VAVVQWLALLLELGLLLLQSAAAAMAQERAIHQELVLQLAVLLLQSARVAALGGPVLQLEVMVLLFELALVPPELAARRQHWAWLSWLPLVIPVKLA